MNNSDGALDFKAIIETNSFKRSIAEMTAEIIEFTKKSKKEAQSMDSTFKKLSFSLAGYFSFTQARDFISDIIRVRNEFQQLEIAFTTMLGNKQKADTLMSELIEFAGTTPFGLKDAAAAAKQLLAYGSSAETVTDELRMLGDVAAGVSAPIGDIVYLYGTLRTQGRAYAVDIRQFAGRGIPIYAELAKVLKVNVDQVASLVSAGKVGFAEVEEAFKNMTAAGGLFGGLMEAQSRSIGGQIERVKDAFDVMLNEIGKNNEGLIGAGIKGVALLIENYEKLLTILGTAVVVYGSYRAALIANAAVSQLVAARTVGMTAAEIIHYGAIVAKTRAMQIYNAVLAASPIAAYTLLIAGLSAAIYGLTQLQNGAELAQETVNNAQNKGAESAENERLSIERLVKVIQDKTAGDEQRKAAYDKLIKQTGDVLRAYDQEAIATGRATDALNTYLEKLRETIEVRAAYEQYQKLLEQRTKLQVQGFDGLSMMQQAGYSLKNTFSKSSAITWSEFGKGLIDGDQAEKNIVADMTKPIDEAIALIEKKYGKGFVEIETGVPIKKIEEQASVSVGARLKEINTEIETTRKELKKITSANATYDSAAIDKVREKLKELEKEKEAITGVSSKAADKSAAKSAKDYNDALSDRADIFLAIQKRTEEYNAKQISAEEGEKNRVKEFFNSIRRDIEEFNKTAPKNLKIGTTVLDNIDKLEKKESDEVSESFATKKLMDQLKKEREIYQDYERYKTETSIKEANNRYSSVMDIVSGFENKLKSEIDKITAVPLASRTFEQNERLKLLVEEQAEFFRARFNDENSYYAEAFNSANNYELERQRIIEDSNKRIKVLVAKGENERARAIAKETSDNLVQLAKSYVEYDESFSKVRDQMNELSISAAREALKSFDDFFENFIKNSELSASEIEKLRKEYERFKKESKDQLTERNFQGISTLINGFGSLVSLSSNLDGDTASVLNNIVQMVGVATELASTFANLTKGLGQTGSAIGGAGAIIGAVLSVAGALEEVQQKRIKEYNDSVRYSNEFQLAQLTSITRVLERQLSLIKDIYGTERITSYAGAVRDAAKQFENSVKALNAGVDITNQEIAKSLSLNDVASGKVRTIKYELTGDAQLDKLIKALNSGGDIYKAFGTGVGQLSATRVDKLLYNALENNLLKPVQKTITDVTKITGEELLELYKMLEDNTLDEITKANVQDIIDSYELWKDATNQLNEELTGVSFDSFVSGIVSMFQQGKVSVEDFAEFFEKQMQQAILNAFARDSIEKRLQGFYDTFAELSKGGLTEKEIADLRLMYNKITEDAKKDFEELKKVTGESFTGSGSQGSLSGAISRTITETTANELSGILRGMFDIVKRMHDLNIVSSQYMLDQNTILRGMFIEIQEIRKHAESMDGTTTEMLTTLRNIDKNTKANQTSRDLGL